MQPCKSYEVGLINDQYSKNQAEFGNGYVKHLDEAIILNGNERSIDWSFFKFLFCVNLNNANDCERLTSGLQKAVTDLSNELEVPKKEPDSFNEQSEFTIIGQTREEFDRTNIIKRAEVITILSDRLKKIQLAIEDGLTLKTACKPFKLCHNIDTIYNYDLEYKHKQLFIDNQLKINKLPT